MIHLALSIASFLFLAGLAMAAVAALVIAWRWVLGALVALAAVALLISTRSDPASKSPAIASTLKAATSPPVAKTLPERLRADPSVVVSVLGGKAWFVSALPADAGHMSIIVEFSPSSSGSVLHGDAKTAIVALRESLCGPHGILEKYAVSPTAVSIIAYENGARVGTVALPKAYCAKGAG